MRRLFIGLAIFAIAVPAPLAARADDRDIAQQIVQSLKAHKAEGILKQFNIGLRVEDGAVYLSGEVANREQERLALSVARHADGVEQVYNQMKVIERAETQLVSAIAEVSDEDEVKAPKKQNLLRRADESASTREAAAIVTADLRRPADEITRAIPVRTPRQFAMEEAKRIATEIISQFRSEKDRGRLRGFGIDVEVDNGTVWLKGHVSSQQQEDLALDIARNVDGVKQVVDDLYILGGATVSAVRTDDEIAQAVVDTLQNHKSQGALRDFGIDVQVENGTVWMSGFVANGRQQQLALDAARYIDGVDQVVDDLTVRKSSVAPATNNQAIAYARQAQAQMPLAYAPARAASHNTMTQPGSTPAPMMGAAGSGSGAAAVRYDHPQMPGYAWPSYAASPNYGAVTYPQQYSPAAWPYIGPFYPYPQVPLGWRKVTLEWDDGWWFLDFKDRR
jgi:osmotically-inducible protein OsmY